MVDRRRLWPAQPFGVLDRQVQHHVPVGDVSDLVGIGESESIRGHIQRWGRAHDTGGRGTANFHVHLTSELVVWLVSAQDHAFGGA